MGTCSYKGALMECLVGDSAGSTQGPPWTLEDCTTVFSHHALGQDLHLRALFKRYAYRRFLTT